ncbi:hypothetical protein [Celeribacter sp.]|uniref:hypothetical protein n=1 Tax=Celeribacter sp. TaxID=1890673 RepID=UPI003A8DBD51
MTSLDACFGLPGGRYTTPLNKIPDVTAAFWLIALKAASFALWFKMEGTLSIHDVDTPLKAAFGDLLSQPVNYDGFGYEAITTSPGFLVVFALTVAAISLMQKRQSCSLATIPTGRRIGAARAPRGH